MNGKVLVYSSHDRGRYLHEEFIVKRALQGWNNKRILFLPMSEPPQGGNEYERQEFSWGNFRYFFDQYRHLGLEAFPFYFSSGLRQQDVDELWHQLYTAEVVVLGGGHSYTGLQRYKALGQKFAGDWNKFGRLLHERRERGLYTVGFSAGADQLCQRLARAVQGAEGHNDAFALLSNTMVRMHHDSSQNGDLAYAAHRFPRDRHFGLPNDSGLLVSEGYLRSGNHYQVTEFITDNSWDVASDIHHVKTRSGAKIDHIYPDGRHFGFSGGDAFVRIHSPDYRFDDAWFVASGQLFHYWSQSRSRFGSIGDILGSH